MSEVKELDATKSCESAVDMQAEISALETVLAQEGLAQNGFTMQK